MREWSNGELRVLLEMIRLCCSVYGAGGVVALVPRFRWRSCSRCPWVRAALPSSCQPHNGSRVLQCPRSLLLSPPPPPPPARNNYTAPAWIAKASNAETHFSAREAESTGWEEEHRRRRRRRLTIVWLATATEVGGDDGDWRSSDRGWRDWTVGDGFWFRSDREAISLSLIPSFVVPKTARENVGNLPMCVQVLKKCYFYYVMWPPCSSLL